MVRREGEAARNREGRGGVLEAGRGRDEVGCWRMGGGRDEVGCWMLGGGRGKVGC